MTLISKRLRLVRSAAGLSLREWNRPREAPYPVVRDVSELTGRLVAAETTGALSTALGGALRLTRSLTPGKEPRRLH